jgi:hypothetical protein
MANIRQYCHINKQISPKQQFTLPMKTYEISEYIMSGKWEGFVRPPIPERETLGR